MLVQVIYLCISSLLICVTKHQHTCKTMFSWIHISVQRNQYYRKTTSLISTEIKLVLRRGNYLEKNKEENPPPPPPKKKKKKQMLQKLFTTVIHELLLCESVTVCESPLSVSQCLINKHIQLTLTLTLIQPLCLSAIDCELAIALESATVYESANVCKSTIVYESVTFYVSTMVYESVTV